MLDTSKNRIDDRDWRVEMARVAFTASNPKEVFEVATNGEKFNTNLLFGYVRSFVRLAYLSDVSAVAQELQTTRHSISLQIRKLENLLECRLFESVGTCSRLTPIGVAHLPRALEIFELASAFVSRRAATGAGYRHIPIAMRELLRNEGAPLILRDFYKAWLSGSQSTSCSGLQQFKSSWILYERRGGVWFSREIGERSALAQWYGVKKATSGAGHSVSDMITGDDLKDEISFILDSLYVKGGAHYSEISCKLPKPGHEDRIHTIYQRVIVELVDDSGNPVFGSMISFLPVTGSADEASWSRCI